MINWLILIVASALCTVILHSLLTLRRGRRERRDLRHVVGIREWWGKR